MYARVYTIVFPIYFPVIVNNFLRFNDRYVDTKFPYIHIKIIKWRRREAYKHWTERSYAHALRITNMIQDTCQWDLPNFCAANSLLIKGVQLFVQLQQPQTSVSLDGNYSAFPFLDVYKLP